MKTKVIDVSRARAVFDRNGDLLIGNAVHKGVRVDLRIGEDSKGVDVVLEGAEALGVKGRLTYAAFSKRFEFVAVDGGNLFAKSYKRAMLDKYKDTVTVRTAMMQKALWRHSFVLRSSLPPGKKRVSLMARAHYQLSEFYDLLTDDHKANLEVAALPPVAYQGEDVLKHVSKALRESYGFKARVRELAKLLAA